MSKQDFLHSHWSRRGLLRAGAATTAASLFPWRALAAIPDQFDGSKFQLAAPEPNPKRGETRATASPCAPRTSTCTSPAP